MKKIILIYLLLINQIVTFGQIENTPMSIGLGGGFDFISNKDDSASPLNYTGFGLPVGVNGFKLSENWINHFEVQFILPFFTNNYPLKSRAKTKLVDWAKVTLRYQLLRKVGNSTNNYIGGELKSNFFYREYDFLGGFSWESQNSINFSFARKININSKSFILPQLSVPLLGYINRKPSLTFDEEFLDDFNRQGPTSLLKYGKWNVLFNQWIFFELNMLYHLNLTDRLNLQSTIGFNYYSINFPEKVQNINIPIRCYLNYQL